MFENIRNAIPMSQTSQTQTWASLLHISLLTSYVLPLPFAGLILPILIWQLKKPQLPDLDSHGRNAANWIISSTIYGAIALVSVIGIPLLPILVGMGLVFPIIAAIKASNGKVWRYPLSLNILGDRARKPLVTLAVTLLLLAILPLSGLLGVGYWANQRSAWLESLIPTSGTVVEQITSEDEDGDVAYRPVIAFETSSGKTYEFSPATASNPPEYRVGDQVDVLYASDYPDRALLNRWSEKWLGLTILGIICGVLLVFSLLPSLICAVLAIVLNRA